jgi:hypothetical protein
MFRGDGFAFALWYRLRTVAALCVTTAAPQKSVDEVSASDFYT